MAKRKSRKKRYQQNLFPIIASGIIVVCAFYFVLQLLIQPIQTAFKQTDDPSEQFIQQLAPHAQKIQKEDGLLASISIGQAILESDWGTSSLSQDYNNLFGIKAFGAEPKVVMSTKEYVEGQWIDVPAAFRSYESWEASLDDHLHLFQKGVNWNPHLYDDVLAAENYQEAASALQKAGYATDPNYDQKIISVIENYNLQRFDQ